LKPTSTPVVAEPKEDKRTAPKELEVIRDESTALYSVRYTAGGELPKELHGSWTSGARAKAAVDNYLATKQQDKK